MDPRIAWLLALSLLGAPGFGRAAITDSEARRLAQLSLEDLMQTEVTSVAGTSQPKLASPAAVTVISGEEIRRAGHRTLAEALRMVPGMYVGRVNSSSWIVGSRGMAASAITANRYLVMIDGRIAHDPLLSTTFWDSADRVVDDIDRIEVIRGPGATLWGQNAMNGVISVITRDARDTLGSVVRGGMGSDGWGVLALRQGNAIEGGAYRLWAKYSRHGDFENAQGVSIEDQWSSLQGGVRLDREMRPGLLLTAQAEGATLPTAHYAVQVPVPGEHRQTRREEGHSDVDGGHLLLRLAQETGEGSGWSLQAYHDRSHRMEVRLDQRRRSHNLDFRQWWRWGAGNEAIWGLQYDRTSDQVAPSPVLQFTPAARTVESFNAFLQNTTELVDDRVWLMAGSKFTHHDFTGLHTQPSLRLWWTPDARQTFWAAVSRPVRVPSRFEENGRLVFSYVDTGLIGGGPASGVIVPLSLQGNPDLPVEKLLAWEVGHRVQIGPRLSLDTALFYNEYQRLVSVPPTTFGTLGSEATGTVYGADLAASFQATPDWRLEGSVSFIETDIRGPVLQFDEDGTPQHLAQLRSTWTFAPGWELYSAVYHVGAIPRLAIGSYERIDLGLTWRPGERTEWTLRGHNLGDPSHPEASGAEVPRSVFAQVTLRL
jgi:iron complex outermembrane receptor protein